MPERVLVIGAYGLIGGYVAARLVREGHEVLGAGRDIAMARRRFPQVQWAVAELGRTTSSEWARLLEGATAVVNCAGALQDSPRDDLQATHVVGLQALIEGCLAARVERFVQISAVGVDQGDSAFVRTRREAEAALAASALDWIVLRPGLVLAPAAYGGSALLRALAAMPGRIPALHADRPVQTVSVEDVAEGVVRALRVPPGRKAVCDLVADEPTTLGDVLRALRAWLGLPERPLRQAPAWLGALAARAADLLAFAGWRSPLRTAALQQLAGGVTGRADSAPRTLGFRPRGLELTLAGWPAGVQERWFARLYFLKPLSLVCLALFWAVSGLVGLFQRNEAAAPLVAAGVSPAAALILVTAGSLLDLVLAGLVAFRRSAPVGLWGMILVTPAYLLAATIWAPNLWADPLGPLVKALPAAVLALLALAMMEER
jgi:uncharacterized protein YbjT (DUF2867 family)